MCGIAGMVSQGPIDGRTIPPLLNSLRHRGPDDEGVYLRPDRKVALIHTRLSILDLSPAGHQPMTNEDKSIWITYNGEIYNYEELRSELAGKGHRFVSRTDTEVILHLYEEEKEAALERLVGIFAFAIYDVPRQHLFLARDRLGVKPLYYADHGGRFIFSSEIKAILAAGGVPVEADWQAILDYFTFLFVPHPQTAFRHIRQLPPAGTLCYDLNSGRITLGRFWSPWRGLQKKRPSPSYGDLRERVRQLVTESVRSELVSDVPLGVFFSGGIDSTILAAIMTRHSAKRVKTFTVGFRGPGFHPHDDLAYARLASEALGTQHHELVVDLEDPGAFFKMVQHVDQPFGNPTLYLQYLIARATRQEVTVALSGVGGDELFGGYPKYWMLPPAPFLGALPAGPGRLLLRFLSLIREDTWVPILRRAKRLLRGVGCELPEQYLRWSYYFTELEKQRLLRGPLKGVGLLPAVRLIQETMAAVPHGVDRYGQVLAAELETFLADNLLEYTDKATMAVALETRVPYLDHRLVEFSCQIPFRHKIRPGQSKYILVDAFRDLLPDTIARAPKRGFSPPIARWMNTVLDRCFDKWLSAGQVARDGLFDWESIRNLRMEHRTRRRDTSMELLSILVFSVWYHRYILGDPLEGSL